MEEETKTETTETTPEADPGEAPEAAAQEAPEKKAPSFDKPLNKMTTPELKEVAMEIPGVTGAHAMKKDELLAVIKEYWEIEDEGPEQKKVQKPVATIKSLKTKMDELRQEKARAREADEKDRVDILRRRINRLKKQTRKVAKA
ncbi:MAG: transcription termination factor Rho [Desulfobacteraceae bacterium]